MAREAPAEADVGQNGFQFEQNVFKDWPIRQKKLEKLLDARSLEPNLAGNEPDAKAILTKSHSDERSSEKPFRDSFPVLPAGHVHRIPAHRL